MEVADGNHGAVCQFVGPDLESAGMPLQLPLNSSVLQLNEVLNTLLAQQDEPVPYAFFVADEQVVDRLGGVVEASKISTEQVIVLRYQPQALFRVRAVSRCSATLPGHAEAVLATQFSPDASMAASASGDTTVRIWEMKSQTPKRTLNAHRNWVLTLAWAPDGKWLASGDKDGLVCAWRDAAQEHVEMMKAHTKWITALAWQPLHRTAHGECELLASASKDATVRIWNVRTGSTVFVLSGHTAAVTCVKWGGEGYLYTASQDRTIKMWDERDGKQIKSLSGHGHWVNTMALSSDYVLRMGAFDEKCRITPDQLGRLKEIAQERYDQAMAKSGGAKGQERLVSGSDDFTLHLWEPMSSSKPLARMTGHQQLVNSVAFSADGIFIASGSFDKSVRLWLAHNGKFVATLRAHVGAVYMVAFSPDSRMLLSASRDSTIKLWNLRTKKMQNDLPGHADEVYAIDWAPDGSRVISGGKDKVIKLWHH
ncbi:Notchless protein-like [Porphyridium purpureum]|uniref:Notchless protein-like n=1 Tax=Porphyridium purpureum TaxID=35688 RepID=A0A5J4Z550_PORPP|nr:Notchless protein-like [Porphyridium purpureum]|eukprot:POR3429..scf295_1